MRPPLRIEARDVGRPLVRCLDLSERAHGHSVAGQASEQVVTLGSEGHRVRGVEAIRRHAPQLSRGAGDEVVDSIRE